jgi:hypothetical protein
MTSFPTAASQTGYHQYHPNQPLARVLSTIKSIRMPPVDATETAKTIGIE